VFTSVGRALKTGTHPWWISRQFLGLITMVFKKIEKKAIHKTVSSLLVLSIKLLVL
jgi:hypothetical protein